MSNFKKEMLLTILVKWGILKIKSFIEFHNQSVIQWKSYVFIISWTSKHILSHQAFIPWKCFIMVLITNSYITGKNETVLLHKIILHKVMSIKLPRVTGPYSALWITNIYTDQFHLLLSVQIYESNQNVETTQSWKKSSWTLLL